MKKVSPLLIIPKGTGSLVFSRIEGLATSKLGNNFHLSGRVPCITYPLKLFVRYPGLVLESWEQV